MPVRTSALLVTNALLLALVGGFVIGERRAQADLPNGSPLDESFQVQDRTDAKNGDLITLAAPTSEGSQHLLHVIDVRKRQLAAYQTRKGVGMALLGARDFRYDLFISQFDATEASFPPSAVRRRIQQWPNEAERLSITRELADEVSAAARLNGTARPGGDIIATIAPSTDGTSRHVLYIIDVVKRQMAAFTTTKKGGIQLVGARRIREDLYLPILNVRDRNEKYGPTPHEVRRLLPAEERKQAEAERAAERGR